MGKADNEWVGFMAETDKARCLAVGLVYHMGCVEMGTTKIPASTYSMESPSLFKTPDAAPPRSGTHQYEGSVQARDLDAKIFFQQKGGR